MRMERDQIRSDQISMERVLGSHLLGVIVIDFDYA
jgi:hypothetical protein